MLSVHPDRVNSLLHFLLYSHNIDQGRLPMLTAFFIILLTFIGGLITFLAGLIGWVIFRLMKEELNLKLKIKSGDQEQ